MVPENVFCLPTFFGQDWFRRHFAISPFWEKKVFVIQRLIVTKKSEFCSQPHFVVKRKAFFCEASKKNAEVSFFFSNFDFFRKKTCTRTSRRAFFEYSFKIGLFTFLQKIRILLGRKKRPVPRKYKILQDSCPPKSKWQIWSWSCGENLWGDIWVGAVSRCGCGVRCAGAGAGAVHVRARFCPHSGVWFLQENSWGKNYATRRMRKPWRKNKCENFLWEIPF